MPTSPNLAAHEPNPADQGPTNQDVQSNPSGDAAASVGGPTAAAAASASEQRTEAETAEAGVDGDASDATQYLSIYDFIKAYTAPNILSEKWDFLVKRDNWLRIDTPSEFVASLEQNYTAEELVELGLYQREGDDLRLPEWSDGDAPLYVSIDEANHTITFSRLSQFLFPMSTSALHCALERIPPDSVLTPATLFVVHSLDAVGIMRRLGLRAVSCDGLDASGRDDIQRLFAGDQRSDFNWRYFLFLVDFDVPYLKNQPTASLGKVIERLADAAELYGVDPARRFGVCRPSPHEFQVLEHAIKFEDTAQISEIFEKWSAAAQREHINSWRTHFAKKAVSFSAARAALVRALQLPNDIVRFEVPAALANYRLAGKGAVIQKFYAEFDRSSDAFDQLDLLAAAGFAETFFDSDPLVRIAEAVLAGGTPPSAAELRAESFELQQRCMREVKRIQRDRKPKRWVDSTARAAAIPKPEAARLAW